MMRRRMVLAAVAVVAAMALPVVGVGQTTVGHGGPPSDVYTSTYRDVCNGGDPLVRRKNLLPTPITVSARSNVVASFTGTISRPTRKMPDVSPALLMGLQVSDSDDSVLRSPEWIQSLWMPGHVTVTVTWTFAGVGPGDYTTAAFARPGTPLDGLPGWNIQACSLTVLVSPQLA